MNSIRDPSVPNMQLDTIRRKFPLGDRLSLAMFACCANSLTPVQILKNLPPLFKFEEQFKHEKYAKMALKLKVCETGSLVLDHHLIHPFVRVHIVDLETYKYLSKSDARKPGVANLESTGFLDSAKHYTRSFADFLLPLSTQMYDLRVKGMNLAQWDEEFVINETANYLLRPNVVFLFEILDFNPNMIFENRALLNADLLYPVAWAYLRPVGTAQIHLSRTRLQLYHYKFKYDEDIKLKRPFDPRTPPVFVEFNWPNRLPYPSFLEVELQFTPKSNVLIERMHLSRMPWEKEIGRESYAHIESQLTRPTGRGKENQDSEPMAKKQLLKKWEKFVDFPCELPDTRVWKFETEALGSFKLKFSRRGKYLAAACTQASSKTLIKIFDVESGELKIVMRGHHDLVHEIQWSHDDNYLITASADCSVKVWNVTQKEVDYSDKLNYTENDVMYYLCSLLHPSYVYAAHFYPDTSYERDERLIIASVCYDQKVRVWMVNVGAEGVYIGHECLIELSIMEKPNIKMGTGGIYEQDQLEDEALELIVRPNKAGTTLKGTTTMASVFDYVHPNCMTFNENGRLFVGDSRGHISVWDLSIRQGNIYADNYFKIRQKELEGDEINLILVHPEYQNKLFVQSRDNCIRLVEYESMKGPRIRKRFFGAKCHDLMIKSCVSPDGQYLVSGSEDGVPYIWNAVTHDNYRTKNYECKFLDLVSDIDWNPKYNMFALSGFGH